MTPTRPLFLAQKQAARRDHARGFVLFQATFWGAFLAVRVYASAAAKPEFLWTYMPNRILLVGVGVLLTTLIHLLLSRLRDPLRRYRFWPAIILCICAIFPMRALELHQASMIGLHVSNVSFLEYVLQFGWALLMWAAYYVALEHAFDVRFQGIALAEAQQSQHEAQIKMLRYQLNPHFLFNSLNAVSALVLERRNGDAEAMLMRLARFLRSTIDTDPMHLSPLQTEFALQRLYIEIEAARFGDRLRAEFNLPTPLADCVIPSLLLQPILENAIKHALSMRAEGGSIRVAALAHDDRLRLIVEDDGPGLATAGPTERRGIGLANTRERLRRFYGQEAHLSLEARAEGGTRVCIELPVQRASSCA